MDFLNPRFRRRHRRRLIIGYSIFSLALVGGTIILALMASGYGITKSGDIVRHGLIFIDSHPSGAKITINGTPHDKTSARILLPAKIYDVVLSKSGFRDWSRQFNLRDQQVISLTYPLLIPKNLSGRIISKYTTTPTLVTQSPDHRWLLIGGSVPSSGKAQLQLVDTQNPNTTPLNLVLPANLLTPSSTESTISFVQWGSDNYHILLKHQFASRTEFINLDRGRVVDSLNLNQQYKLNPTDVRYADSAADQFFLYDGNSQALWLTNGGGLAAAPRLKTVLAYHVLSANRFIYVKTSPIAGSTDVRIWENGQDYLLTRLAASRQYFVDGVLFQGVWYYAVASDQSGQALLYRNPVASLSQVPAIAAKPLVKLNVTGLQQLNFSPNARFLYLSNDKSAVTYDIFNAESHQFQSGVQPQPTLAWLDSYHFGASLNGQAQISDFDGSNRQALASTNLARGGFLSGDSHYFLTLSVNTQKQTTLSSFNLQPKIPLSTSSN